MICLIIHEIWTFAIGFVKTRESEREICCCEWSEEKHACRGWSGQHIATYD